MGLMTMFGLLAANAAWGCHLLFFLYFASGKQGFGGLGETNVVDLFFADEVENRFNFLVSLFLAAIAFIVGLYVAALQCLCCVKCCLNCLPCCCGLGCCPTFVLTLILCALGAAADFAATILMTGPVTLSVGAAEVVLDQDFGYGILGLIGGGICFVLVMILFIVDCLTCGGKAFGRSKDAEKKKAADGKDLVAV